MKGFLDNHVIFKEYTPNLEKRVIDQYIKRLDGAKIYLLESDVIAIKAKLKDVYSKIKSNHCEVLTEVEEIVKKRVAERAEFAIAAVGKDFVFNKNEEIVVDSKQREFAKTKKQSEDYQKKYIQFQIANYLAADMKLEEAKEMLKHRYERAVKTINDQTNDDMLAGFLDSFARALDPHSSYFSKDVLEDFEIQMNLSLEGIGATLSSQDGYTVIEQLIAGGAAADSGMLKVQDKIIAVAQGDDGKMEPIIDMELRDVVRKIRGKKGTKVRLTILRKAADKTERFEAALIRKKINLEDEAAQISYVERNVNGKKMTLAVLDLPSFYSSGKAGERSAAKDMKALLAEARAKKADGLVVDFSNNGGGSLDDAVKIAGLFIKTGNVVQTEKTRLADTDSAVDWAGPVVVLTSRISASASEIVSGALRDYKRAVIVGADHTFGKGSVQSVLPLPAGLGAIKVTVGMFYIPGGDSTQHRGVDGDVVLPSAYALDDIGEKTMDYSLPPKKIPSFISKDAYVTSGDEAWKTIEPTAIKKLQDASSKRVASSKEFDKVKDDLRKNKERSKVVKLNEVLKDKSEAEEEKKRKKVLSREDKKAEYLKRPDVQEAINVLEDLISVQNGQPLTNVIADKAPTAKGADKH